MRDGVPIQATDYARALRMHQTDAEKKLWRRLRDRRMQGLKFRRQSPIGPYIVDFLCVAHRLIVEADRSQHAESGRDTFRDAWLNQQGFRVLRFWNHDVLTNTDGVLATVAEACGLPW